MRFFRRVNHLFFPSIMLLTLLSAASVSAHAARAAVVVNGSGGLGVIKGVVRDDGGNPISEATVAIFRAGTSKLLKQVTSGSDGSFLAKILPGTYTVLAVAQGFNPMTLFGVEVARSAELTYGFRLERAGSGNTLPERRSDRNSSKWRIRAAQAQRSIYQNRDGSDPLNGSSSAEEEAAGNEQPNPSGSRKGQTVVETYFADGELGSYAGVNVATFVPVNEKMDVSLVAQTGAGRNTPQRLAIGLKYRPNANHQLRLDTSAGRLGNLLVNGQTSPLGQTSVRATDEWKVREGVILVLGLDYSRFVGAGSDWVALPRLGFQYDINSKTRFRAAFTTETEKKTWADAVNVEGAALVFTEPVAVDDLVVVDDKPRMNKSRRVEFGVERVLDNRSSIEANAFADTTFSRGVGLESIALTPLGDGFNEFVADQQGSTQGIRVVYTRRLNGLFTTAAGYSFGKGQKLSDAGLTDPSRVFESEYFQTFFGQIDADLKTGTSVKTIFRLSPQAAVFAIDPFKGRLAIYDPGLSILVTQDLPTLGLPLRAQAVLDARNVLDLQTGIWGEDGSLKLSTQGMSFRGGIQVRF